MIKESRNLVWIIGQGGLLGSALSASYRLQHPESILWTPPGEAYSWDNSTVLQKQLETRLHLFKIKLADYTSWTIIWTAGAGVVGTSLLALEEETKVLSFFINRMERTYSLEFNQGSFFLASSAGGVWGGTQIFPIEENTPRNPISDYGRQKLIQEEYLQQMAHRNPSLRILIGRISNLYGPGQKLHKPQGLLSQLCRSTLLKIPLNVFVPLETLRDYIFMNDCAELVIRALIKVRNPHYSPQITTKIFASEEPATISEILGLLKRLTGQDAPIINPPMMISRQQPQVLWFRSHTLVENYLCKPLIEGLSELLDYQETQLQLGKLPFPEAS